MGRRSDRDGESGRDEGSEVYFTTHQVAQFLGVSVPTIVNWIDAQRLKAHRTPGGHRRIAQSEVAAFAGEHGFPLPRQFWRGDAEEATIVIVDDDAAFADTVREYLTAKGPFDIAVATTPFEAGYHIGRYRPDVVLCDPRVARLDGLGLATWLRAQPDTRGVVLLACTMLDEIDERVGEAFDEVLQKPVKLHTLLEVIERRLRSE